jgi:hypothetical protein
MGLDAASILQRVTFGWASALVARGAAGSLDDATAEAFTAAADDAATCEAAFDSAFARHKVGFEKREGWCLFFVRCAHLALLVLARPPRAPHGLDALVNVPPPPSLSPSGPGPVPPLATHPVHPPLARHGRPSLLGVRRNRVADRRRVDRPHVCGVALAATVRPFWRCLARLGARRGARVHNGGLLRHPSPGKRDGGREGERERGGRGPGRTLRRRPTSPPPSFLSSSGSACTAATSPDSA